MLRGRFRGLGAQWLGRASFAIVDQSLISGTAFALNILFTRWMSATDFGVLAVLMACILIISSFQNALVLEPMTVLGSQKYRVLSNAYVRQLGLMQLAVLFVLGGVAFVVLAISGGSALLHDSLAFGLTLSSTMLFFFVRRVIYLKSLPHLSAIAAAISAAASVILALWWSRAGDLPTATAMNIIAAGSTAGAIAGWWLLWWRARHRAADSTGSPAVREIFQDHWRYGRWALGTAVVYIGSSTAYPLIISSLLDFEAAGTFRAVEVLFAPVGQFVTALSTLTLPALAARRDLHDRPAVRSLIRTVLLGAAAVACAYVVPMVLFGPMVATYVFAKSEYASAHWLISWMGLATVLGVLQSVAFLFLRSIERPHGEFFSQSAVTAVTFTVGIGSVMLAGLNGLTSALVMAKFCGLLIALRILSAQAADGTAPAIAADPVANKRGEP